MHCLSLYWCKVVVRVVCASIRLTCPSRPKVHPIRLMVHPLREYLSIFKDIQAYSMNFHVYSKNIQRICSPCLSVRPSCPYSTSLPPCLSFMTTLVLELQSGEKTSSICIICRYES